MGAAVAIAQKFPWKNYKTFADVGAAQGAVPVQVALAHPHLKGLNFDLPQVGPIFDDYVRGFGLSDRLSFQAGDFFKEQLPKVDVIIMGHILHDWNLEEKKLIVKRAFDALPRGAPTSSTRPSSTTTGVRTPSACSCPLTCSSRRPADSTTPGPTALHG